MYESWYEINTLLLNKHYLIICANKRGIYNELIYLNAVARQIKVNKESLLF